jgi:hypothetical protein
MHYADVWQRTRSLAQVLPPGTRPQLTRRVRLWTLKKEAELLFSKIAEKTARSREEYLESVPPRRGVSAKRHMPDADVWQRTRSLAQIFPPGTRPQLKRRVRLWTLKKEAELLFQKSRKRPQEVGKNI